MGGNRRGEGRVPNKSEGRKKYKEQQDFSYRWNDYMDVIKRRHISQGMMER